MALIGTIEAGLQGSRTYQRGGLGPLFRQERVQTPLRLDAFLDRTLRAFERLREVTIISLFIDETEIYRLDADEEEEAEEDLSVDELLDWVRAELKENPDATTFHLMLAHDDREFSHVFSIEAEADHAPEDPAIAVLDAAEPAPNAMSTDATDDEPSGWTFESSEPDDEGELGGLHDYGADEDDLLDRLEAFMERLMHDLDRELALDAPEVDVWVDYQGEYDMMRHYSSIGYAAG